MKLLLLLLPVPLAVFGQIAQPARSISATSMATSATAGEAPRPAVRPEDKCSIEGTAVNATTGAPLNKVHLTLRPVGAPNGTPYGTVSDSGGHFLIDGVDPGQYSFSAVRSGFVRQAYSAQGDRRRATTLSLRNGENLKQVTFKLTPQGVITGRVLDQDGDPLQKVQIQCMARVYQRGRKELMPAQSASTASTNDLGEFRLFGLAPGKYIIAARSQSMDTYGPAERVVGTAQAIQEAEQGYMVTYYPNTTNPDSASQIEIAAGALISGMDLTLTRTKTARIKGHVNVPASGQRRPNVSVMLFPRDSGGYVWMPTASARVWDASGNFEMRGVPAGAYILTGNWFGDGQRYTARMPVDVSNSNVEGVELTFQPPLEMKGRLMVEDNGDLKGATVNITLAPRTIAPMAGGGGGPVNEDLTFKISNLGLETYDLNAFGMPEGFYVKSVRLGDQDVTDTGLDLTRGVPAGELRVVINPQGGQIEGKVQNSKGENAAGAMVTLIPDEKHRSINSLYKIANTDQNGHFSMKGLRPGEYKLYAWEEIEAGAYQDPDFLKLHDSAGKDVSVKEAGHEMVQLSAVSAGDSAGTTPH